MKTPHKIEETPHRALFLSASVFLSGGAVLVLEILGARVLSPFFGSSVYSWSAVITVTLASLAVGYWAGGTWADQGRGPRFFYGLIAAAGGFIFLTAFLKNAVLSPASSLSIGAGCLAASIVLFGPPLFVLGATGPLAIRRLTPELGRLGRGVGNVYAVSTAGSVAGALLAGFVLVPHAGVKSLLVGLGLFLVFLGGAGFFVEGRRNAGALLAALSTVFVPLFLRAAPHQASNLLFNRPSFYGDVKVVEMGRGERFLLLDGVVQGVVHAPTGEPRSEYLSYLELLPRLVPGGRRALVIGLGAGYLPTAYHRHDGLTVDAVEIDPVVARAAREKFGYRPSGDLFIADGRAHLERSGRTYDIIVLDAFASERTPFHLFTKEFFEKVRERLAPGGVLGVNTVGNPDQDAWVSVHKTIAAAFPVVRQFATVSPAGGLGNLIFVASAVPTAAPDLSTVRPEAREILERMSGREVPPPDGARSSRARVFTDDFNPIDDVYREVLVKWRKRITSSSRGLLLYESEPFS